MKYFAPQVTASLLSTLIFAGLLSACVEQTTEPTYVRQSSPTVEHAYVMPGADFSQYSKLMSGGLEIYYPESNDAPPAEDLERIRAAFVAAFTAATAGAYEWVDTAGPDVLLVTGQLIDMKVTGAGSDYNAGGRLKSLVAYGELTFLMEMADSRSGEVLARAGDRTKDVTTGEDAAEWAAVDRAAAYWAGLFRNWLDDSLGKPGQE